MVRAYIAGLLWEENHRIKLEQIDKLCKSLEIDTYLPHRDAGIYKEGMESAHFFNKDKDMIDWCDIVVAVLNWEGIGSGTAWEIGYAYAKNKPIIGIVEDKNSINKEFRTCVMCVNSAKLVEGLDELKKELIKIKKQNH